MLTEHLQAVHKRPGVRAAGAYPWRQAGQLQIGLSFWGCGELHRYPWPAATGSCGSNSVVECNLAKVDVEGSNPFSRSIKFPCRSTAYIG